MTTTPNEPVQDPDVAPSGDPQRSDPSPVPPSTDDPDTDPGDAHSDDAAAAPGRSGANDAEPGQMPDHDTEVGA